MYISDIKINFVKVSKRQVWIKGEMAYFGEPESHFEFFFDGEEGEEHAADRSNHLVPDWFNCYIYVNSLYKYTCDIEIRGGEGLSSFIRVVRNDVDDLIVIYSSRGLLFVGTEMDRINGDMKGVLYDAEHPSDYYIPDHGIYLR